MAARHSVDPDGWTVIFNELMTRIASHFGRVEPRRAATAYVRALLADIDRKNCWNLAEHAGLTGRRPCSDCSAPPAGTPMPSAMTSGTSWSTGSAPTAGQVGLDHYQVRGWTAWQRHITLAMLALAS